MEERLSETVRFSQLKPKDTMAVRLSEPEGWQPPSDRTLQQ